ncbi:diacylglycerol kinase family protein [Patescibacteria group bacterium]|nr:diacylglycerol kinase family protein [Patescibacteria group bacterium]MBU4141859.1 diacylglycerol kinase family protein [Patescibacteria group bacterium]MBU4338573.1 diacylglycerol kinase family protein [Patescibacteria group bacterium]MBU4579866.1 diacylglycerol kinase family protein [Patescibacteria group bacterium]
MLDQKKLVKSFYYALKGLVYLFKTEQNFRIEVFGMFFVIFGMFYFGVSWTKITFVSLLFLLILSFEIINTVFEEITDFFIEERKRRLLKNTYDADMMQDKLIGHIKDLAAALVLFACMISLLIAIAIFLKI